MKPVYIFDLDGTLADISHRRHLVECEPKQWREFYAACEKDMPNRAVISTAKRLLNQNCEVWVWSGRSDEVFEKTKAWLWRGDVFFSYPLNLKMRQAKDHQPDVKLKRQWLHELSPEDRARIVAVFDDRTSVVNMWREEGIPCFQVAPGDF